VYYFGSVSGYIDLQEEAERALQEREYRRRRLLGGIRGCLRKHTSPKLLVLLALFISAVPGTLVAILAHAMGVSLWGPAPALALLAMCPVFVLVCRNIADRLYRKFDFLSDLNTNIALDMALDIEASEKQYGPRSEFSQSFQDTFWREVGRGMGKDVGSGGIIVFLIVGLITLGSWIVWDLMKYGPALFSEIIYDGCLSEKCPALYQRASVEPWMKNALTVAAVYFIILAVIAIILGGVLYCVPTTGWGKIR
jgi:hypothetical protein